jgi:hypothetical protein
MIRTASACLTLSLFVTLLSAGQDPAPNQPRPTLKKKDQPGPEPKPGETTPDDKTRELLARVARNMESSEDRLKNRDPGEKTRAIQDQIIKDLDELIRKAQEEKDQESKSQQSAGSSQGDPSKTSQDRRSKRNSSQQQAKPKPGAKKQDSQASQGQPAGGQGKSNKEKQSKGGSSMAGGGGNSSAQKKNTIADLFRDVWGHLPEQKRQEMDAYSRERFMPRYDELLRQYYRTLAEQSRKKDE